MSKCGQLAKENIIERRLDWYKLQSAKVKSIQEK
jgi:hypothetical protein